MNTRLLAVPLLALVLSACDPHYNWRDYRSKDAPYSVLLPGKPATHARDVRLGELPVRMTMSAAEVDDVVFAVGSAELTDTAQAPAALLAMQTALARNIGATITSQATVADGAQTTVSIEAKGMRNGEPTLLIGRFIARDRRVYQVVVMGAERHIAREQVATFLDSFKLQ
ncbi:hypothetical protein ASF04_07890 [Duganella sp. Leaf61]|uniref:hypothetical protein n=1 Tax=Duganella sp. Leaf61 TaxID=1736227 RepID=UPI0006F26E5B|nr:hypothetical protein [Duganella sp. Leaf61]KQN75951.1 hypothetical protein ASF04_07890 [Duganella sp. Leaf61]